MKFLANLKPDDLLLIAGLCTCVLPYLVRVWTRPRGPSAEQQWRSVEHREVRGPQGGVDPIARKIAELTERAQKAERADALRNKDGQW